MFGEGSDKRNRERVEALRERERDIEAAWWHLTGSEAISQGKSAQGGQGMGSGPKFNSVVFKCIRPIVGEYEKGPCADCIHQYPILAKD